MGIFKKDGIEELIYTHRLADVENSVRVKALKKLKTFLQAKSSWIGFTYDDFLKIWKGLYYCMYMADKPLVQEDLAEEVSCLIHQLSSNSQKILFFHVAMDTYAREWDGIDNFRLDKFLMLFTRTLRQCLIFLKSIDWDISEVKRTSAVLEKSIISPFDHVNKISLGLKIHLADCFLEELAKVGQESLPDEVLLTFMKPFLKVIAASKQSIYVQAIENGIVLALIKQSDLGIENQEDMSLHEYEMVEEEEEEENPEDDYRNFEEEEVEKRKKKKKKENQEEDEEDFVMDPRAGGVDVHLPQLKPDYKEVANTLVALGALPEVPQRRRKLFYNLGKMFLSLANGNYPLKLNLKVPKDINRKKVVRKAVKKLQKLSSKRQLEDEDEDEDDIELAPRPKKKGKLNDLKGRRGKPQKRSAKVKLTKEESRKILMDKMKTEHSLEKKLKKLGTDKKSTKKSKTVKEMKSLLNNNPTATKTSIPKTKRINQDTEEKIPKIILKSTDSNKVLKGKARKAKTVKVKSTSPAVASSKSKKESPVKTKKKASPTEVTKNSENSTPSVQKKKKKRNNALRKNKLEKEAVKAVAEKASTSKPKKIKKDPWSEPIQKGEVEIVIPGKKMKKVLKTKTKMNLVIKKTPKINTKGKTLKINLGQNKEHDIRDYTRVLKSSPGIPYSAHKKPTGSVLKKSSSESKKSCSKRINLMKSKYCSDSS